MRWSTYILFNKRVGARCFLTVVVNKSYEIWLFSPQSWTLYPIAAKSKTKASKTLNDRVYKLFHKHEASKTNSVLPLCELTRHLQHFVLLPRLVDLMLKCVSRLQPGIQSATSETDSNIHKSVYTIITKHFRFFLKCLVCSLTLSQPI